MPLISASQRFGPPPFGGTSLLQVSELEAVITKKTP